MWKAHFLAHLSWWFLEEGKSGKNRQEVWNGLQVAAKVKNKTIGEGRRIVGRFFSPNFIPTTAAFYHITLGFTFNTLIDI